MTYYYLQDGLREAIELAEIDLRWRLLDAQTKAADLMKKSVFGDVALAAVQGPPGTGKTSVVEAFAKTGLAQFVSENERELIVYAAPTNHLTFNAFKRIASQLLRVGYSVETIASMVRVYGSRITPFRNRESVETRGKSVTSDEVSTMMGRIDDKVRLVFSTEFQRFTNKLGQTVPKKIHIVADEASKSPFFRVFIPIADSIVANPDYYPSSLLVLGDHQQAIGVSEEYRNMEVPLLIRHVESILKSRDRIDKDWIMLDTTFRLPDPSHSPISHGYYHDALRSEYSAKERMGSLKDGVIDNAKRIVTELDSKGIDVKSDPFVRTFNAIQEAMSSDSPIVIIKTPPFNSGDTFDPNRVKMAFLASAILQLGASLSKSSVAVTTTSPYSDIVEAISFRALNKLGKGTTLDTVTVQSLIGGESDVVVAALGKEWAIGGRGTLQNEEMSTIYQSEPEILNVQLSRHKSLLVVVGDLDALGRFKERRIQDTCSRISQMDRKGVVIADSR